MYRGASGQVGGQVGGQGGGRASWTVLEQAAAGESVVTRVAVQGSFSGPPLGLAPPGRPAALTGVVIGRFEGGRLAGIWLQADLLEQLG